MYENDYSSSSSPEPLILRIPSRFTDIAFSVRIYSNSLNGAVVSDF